MTFIHSDTVLVIPNQNEYIDKITFLFCKWCRIAEGGTPFFNFQEQGLIQYPQSKFMAHKYQDPYKTIDNRIWQKVYINTQVYDYNRYPLGFHCSITSWIIDQVHPYGQLEQNSPRNNQGLSNCFWCGDPTKKIDSGFSFYNYCPKCKK